MITDAHLDELRALFVKHRVVLAYLFGSYAEGTARPSSDVDVAVLLPPGTPRGRFFEARLDLTNALMDLFDKNEVDVAILNEVSALLAYEVAQHGILLHEDAITRPAQDFVISATLNYADTAHFRQLALRYLSEEIEQYRIRRSVLAVREKPDDQT